MKSCLCLILLVAAFLLSACQNEQKIGEEIETDLRTMTTDQSSMGSSNPITYMTNNKEAYNRIVDHGQKALTYLTKELKASDSDGLKEWIMAKACADILQEKNPVKQWETGKQWLAKYEEAK